MIFADLPGGASVFVDANTLVYHFQRFRRGGVPCLKRSSRFLRVLVQNIVAAPDQSAGWRF
jgi:hypothetical protein